jgi:hypothetical protein
LVNLNFEDLTSQLTFKKTMFNNTHAGLHKFLPVSQDRRGRDRMEVRFTTTYGISAWSVTKVLSSNSANGEVYSMERYVMQFVSDLWQIGGFPRFPHQKN